MDQQTQIQKDRAAALDRVEKEVAAMLEGFPHADEMEPTYKQVVASLTRAQRTAWAAKRFPFFDTKALCRMKHQKVMVEVRFPRLERKQVELWVPVFGVAPYSSYCSFTRSVTWFVTANRIELGILFDGRLIRQNAEVAARLGETSALEAVAPDVPMGIRHHVSQLDTQFDSFSLVWEAEWQPAPVGDPLILGHVGKLSFLVDQFDTTKLEKYIVGEYCQKPKREE